MGWCTIWKCHLRCPVLRSTQTRLSPNRSLPGRWPPYRSDVGSSTGRYTRPASSSTVICDHTPVLPLVAHDSRSQVSLPNSPGRGIVLNVHSVLPVRTSYAWTSPFVLLWVLTVRPSRNDEPTSTTSFATVGVEWSPISPVSRLICSPLPTTAPIFMSTIPSLPNVLIGWPVCAFSDTRRYPVVTKSTRSSPLPSVQYARPRPDNWRGAAMARAPSRSE